MAGMTMQKAMRYLKRKLDATVAQHVTLIAPGEGGGESLEDVEAVPVTASFRDYTTDEFAGSAQEFDWIVKEADLVFPLAGKRAPADGWQLRLPLDDGRTAVYVVRPSGAGRCYDVEDPLGILMIVHTKLEKIEP